MEKVLALLEKGELLECLQNNGALSQVRDRDRPLAKELSKAAQKAEKDRVTVKAEEERLAEKAAGAALKAALKRLGDLRSLCFMRWHCDAPRRAVVIGYSRPDEVFCGTEDTSGIRRRRRGKSLATGEGQS